MNKHNFNFAIGIIFIFLMISGVSAIDISSCQTINAPGNYDLTQSISSATTCLTITSSNVQIDCKGYKINYNSNGVNGAIGINAVNGQVNYNNLTIKNCIIAKPMLNGTTSYGIQLSRFSNSTIFNNTIMTNGTSDNYGIYLLSFSLNNNISSNAIYSRGSTTNNFGIYLGVGTINTTIEYNSIETLGTGTNYGIQVVGNATSPNNNNFISNNLIRTSGTVGAGGASNYGIYLTTNVNYNNITSNNITTNGTTTNHGIYITGVATTTPVYNNSIENNTILAYGRAAGVSNYGIHIRYVANGNNIINNKIITFGTTTNYGIYVLGTAALPANSNRVISNRIQTLGNTTNNYGIYLVTNTNNNNITDNDISTNGTTGNAGIVISGATFNSLRNLIFNNTISTFGTTTNYGVLITTNSSYNNVSDNNIFSNGTTTSYGIFLTGVANGSINSTYVSNNRVRTTCSAASSACYGIFLQNNVNENLILNNLINTSGTTTNYGIYLFGTAILSVDNNILDSNIIRTTGAVGAGGPSNYGIYLTANTNSNNVTNNDIVTNGTTTNYGIFINGAATTTSAHNNLVSNNSIIADGRAAAVSNIGIYVRYNANNNKVILNNITTYGTTANYGIHILGTSTLQANSNSIDSNIIKTLGNTTNNYGIYLATNTNGNNVTSNIISTNGTTGNAGIVLSGATYVSHNNTFAYNRINTFGTTTNHGIYLTTNSSQNNITNNIIYANGTTTSYGIYLTGILNGNMNNNHIESNTISTTCSALTSTCHGIYLQNQVNSNKIIRNRINATGTSVNYGIYLFGTAILSANDNVIESNEVSTNGQTINNYGIYLLTNSNRNNVSNNIISTSGTTGNNGLVISGATFPSNYNLAVNNSILAQGTSTNYGIQLLTNTSYNNLSLNSIITDGTTLNYGIHLLGAAGTPVESNIVSLNNVSTICSSPLSSCHAIYLLNLVNQNIISKNTLQTSSTLNIGVYLLGTASLTLSSNELASNIINSTNADRIAIGLGVYNTTLNNNTLLSNNNYYDLNITSTTSNGTILLDQYFERYSFTGAGTNLNFKNQQFGEIAYISPVNGSGTNLSEDIIISRNFVSVNSNQVGLNKSAIITLYNLSIQNPVIIKDGVYCQNCNVLSNTLDGNVSFSVTSFSNYTISENSRLYIDDSADGSSNNNIMFYANYTNTTSYQPILSAMCFINFTSGSNLMTYNSTSLRYEYNDILFAGANNYQIECSASGYSTLTLSDYASISAGKIPTGVNVTEIETQRALPSNPQSSNAQAGNITPINIFGETITQSWQGYAGNITGVIELKDMNENIFYNWSAFSPSGEIYATRASDVNFASIGCANSAVISSEESDLGQSSSDPDSVSNTFNQNSHPEFSVGIIPITQNSCNSTHIYDFGGVQYAYFTEILLADAASNVVYTSILEQDRVGFDYRTHDFEMIVGENGHNGDNNPSTYYFFMEIQ